VLLRALVGFAAAASLTAALAQAQEDAALPAPSDEALRTERARSTEVFRRLDALTPPGQSARERVVPSITAVPGRAPDPAAIADRFRRTQTDTAPRGPALLLFVSFSMPPESLLRLAHQARRADGVLVFRGLAGATLREMVGRVEPLAKTGATIEINPDAFARFGVEVVPTFVLAESLTSCGDETCEGRVRRIAGDVTLDYALERLARADGAIGSAAAARLNTLRGGR
jgi:conjugal transfer pilus assembly protein TrbC